MSALRELARSRTGIALAALVALGGILRFATLGQQSYWYDEAVTVSLLERPLHELVRGIADSESTPPLYYVVAWFWAKLAGTDEVALRSLSALAGTLLIPVAFVAGRLLVSPRAGLAAAGLAAVSPMLIWYSQEARAYALLTLLAGVSFVLFALVRADPSRGRLVAWTVVSALALATHYYAAFVVVAEAALVLWTYPRLWRARWAVAAVLAAGAALVPLAALQLRHRRLDWIGGLDLGDRATEALQRLVGAATPSSWAGATGAELAPHAWLAAAAAVLVAATLLLTRGTADERRGGAIAFAVAALSLAAPVAISLLADLVAGGDGDLFLDRNVLGSWLPLATFVAAGLAARRAGALGAACLAGLVAWSLVVHFQVVSDVDLQRDDWQAVADAVPPQNSVVIVYPAYQEEALRRQRDDLATLEGPTTARSLVVVLTGFDEPPDAFTAPPAFTRSRLRKLQHFTLLEYDAPAAVGVAPGDLVRGPAEESDLAVLAAR